MSSVVIAVPCHRDEPAIGATVRALAGDASGMADTRIIVCVNGRDAEESPAARQLRAITDLAVPLEVIHLERASKPAAWNALRDVPADITVFADADIGVEPGSIPALVGAIEHGDTDLAAAAQRPYPAVTAAGRAAVTPFRLAFGGLAGTLYAARTAALPGQMPGVLLDDAWLFGTMGEHRVVHEPKAVAWFKPVESWRDLWRQRRRAEAGKQQLRAMNVPLARAPEGLGARSVLRDYPRRELPAVLALAVVKAAAAVWSRVRPARWEPAVTTKS